MADQQNKYQMAGIGEVLWDLLPDGKQLGGSPMNVVYHCKSAGIKSVVVSAIGADDLGTEILDELKQKNLSSEYVQILPGRPTGTVTVKLTKGIPDFTIHPDVAWDEIKWSNNLESLAKSIDAVAFGSLSQRNKVTNNSILRFLKSMKPDSLRVFDVTLRQIFHSAELLDSSLKLSNILKLNDEELPVLAKYFRLKGPIKVQLLKLIRKYSLDLVAYTMGSEGSWLMTRNRISEMKAPEVQIEDTVGAGDAFTGVLIARLLQKKPLEEIHAGATAVAASVCTKAGGTPEHDDIKTNFKS